MGTIIAAVTLLAWGLFFLYAAVKYEEEKGDDYNQLEDIFHRLICFLISMIFFFFLCKVLEI